ncbi:DUF4862 family protein [Cellulosimicrobium protaetiae]|uniref:DUF4862 family protein n=1 Tax=Cellulosimicrobium protaetiae TaxID=2587808 RepID=A0A6M5UIP0_9MICO|nr:DUF4862 family protein [Cellulosimicrobium protaetiae]QJW36988.1 DUF4862 family protein [Cellulosimicrobium protaetiae]
MDDQLARPLTLLGAYALAGVPDPGGWYAALDADGLDGLEHPVDPDDAGALATVAAGLPGHWSLVPTTVAATARRATTDRAYGLASDDEAGRRAAVDGVGRVLDAVARLAESEGRRRVVAVELQSAPGPGRGSGAALARSLTELAAVAPAGLPLVVEHCDAPRPWGVAEKGFLPLDDEIAAVARAARDTGHPLHVGLNWGRSAIEGRSAATPVEHARAAAASGLLASAMLSGASGTPGRWGEPWSDAHVPPHGTDPALPRPEDSMLGPAEVREFLAAAGPVPIVGAKVTARPSDAAPAERLAVARATLAVLRDALEDVLPAWAGARAEG